MNYDERTLERLGYVREPDGSYFKRPSAGVQHRNPGPVAELERHPGNGDLGALPVQTGIGRPFLVRVTAFRRRLLDEDNLCEKYHVDLCRYAGALPSDAAGKAKIETTQEKVGSKEREFVRIEIFRL